jgi:hypothetical protein
LYCLLLQKLFLLASNKKVERAVLRTALVFNFSTKAKQMLCMGTETKGKILPIPNPNLYPALSCGLAGLQMMCTLVNEIVVFNDRWSLKDGL